MKPLLVSSGEPSGVGPDLCLALAGHEIPLVVLGDKSLLKQRASQLGLSITVVDYDPHIPITTRPNHLTVLSLPCSSSVVCGRLNTGNVPYVMNMLNLSSKLCLQGDFSALVTAPVHKGIINQAGIVFTGHTEFFADYYHVKQVVMMLACEEMKIALVTTHQPLKNVASMLTPTLIAEVIEQLNQSLQHDFGIDNPKIYVAGLNPHAGESGYLGREEIDMISPTLTSLKNQGIDIHGPFSADTLFTRKNAAHCDVFVAMYHDQGLPVLKYAGFGSAVNITLGLPIIRTSVDHGTALELAGTGQAEASSLLAAVTMAASIVRTRKNNL